ncbi:MAG: hypothetical protein LC105_07655 [Chitinophagales bacterium]|nr:hypothetical protein [Chitinophagales bacterium]MCZ2393712.1 hypothetical protein [Chitinophagales bacterium]
MRFLFCVFLVLFSLQMSDAQQHDFDVILMNKKIGEMSVSKVHNGNNERYTLNSESSAKVLFIKQDSKVNFNVLYNGGVMVESFYKSEKKDDNIITKVLKEGSLYQVYNNNQKSLVKDQIGYSSIMMYFKEPIGITKVFVERFGGFLPLKKTASNTYEYSQPDGTTSIYKYFQGVLKEIELKRTMGSIFIRRTL